jgi:peptidoglycan/LPS O-acetylase OafA/YrhL
MRTVAIYLVLLFHAGLAHVANGYIGVDVFFVLSGFLVTSIIVKEHTDSGTLRLRRFYARRVRRLLPASVVLVVATCAFSTLVLPKLSRVGLVSDARAALLYVANWHFLGQATDYFADDVQRSPFLHFWSLAVEEQFYFVFPLLLLGLLVLARRRSATWMVPSGLAALLVASAVGQWWVAGNDPLRAYYGTDTRLYQLLAGALLATLRHRLPRSTRWGGAGALGSLAVLVVLATDLLSMSVATRGIAAAVVTVVCVSCVEMAPATRTARVLSTRPMTYLGRISYGTYLWHWPVIVLVGAGWMLTPLEMAGVAAVAATAISAVSFHLLETPIRRAPRLDGWPRGVVAVGLASSLVVAVVLVPVLLESDRRPTFAARGPSVAVDTAIPGVDMADLAAAMAVVPPTDLDLAPTVTPKFDQAACTVDTIDGCFVHRGNGLHLHLTGDSNAQMLVPVFQALAEQYDFTLTATIRLGCPWQTGLEWDPQDEVLVRNCNAARDDWYGEVLPLLQPDVLVAVHVPRDRGSRQDSLYRAGPGWEGDIDQVVADTTAATLDRFHDLGMRTVLLEPLPYGPKDPTICVSGASTVGDCAYEANAEPFPTEATYRREDAARDDVWAVDADRLACPFLPVCLPMIDGDLVYENQFHLSSAWVVDRADAWWALLVGSGALEGWFDPS